MKYKIGDFILDENARKLVKDDVEHKIRPKTLSLLLYLASRNGEIISKQELLEKIWDDVAVDEGVVFQSVREVRQLFNQPDIIRNHPRKGYEFTETLTELSKSGFSWSTQYLVAAVALCIVLIGALFWPKASQQDVNYQHRILVLPIKNQVAYGEHEWIYLGGMEQLIAKLQGLPSGNYVYPGNQVLRTLHAAGLDRDFDSSQLAKIARLSGASMVVETELYGNTSDYKLVYRLHIQNDVRQGVVLDPLINDALSALSEKIAESIDFSLTETSITPQSEFSDALFAQAMITYEKDWQTSVSFFQSYLALNPDSVIAHIYLSKLYLWQNDLRNAKEVITRASELPSQYRHDQAHIKLLKGRLAAKSGNLNQAHQLYDEASDIITNHNRWFLKASIAEEKGLAFLSQGSREEAIATIQQAINYYQITRSTIGINSSRLHLARAFYENGQIVKGKSIYEQAQRDISESELEFLYEMLEEYTQAMPKLFDTEQ